MTRGGLSTTHGEMSRRKQSSLTGVSMPAEAQRADFLAHIAELRCWWCKRDKNQSGAPLKSLSGHWVSAHGVSLSEIRNFLQVSIHGSLFISSDTKKRMRDSCKARIAKMGASGPQAWGATGGARGRHKNIPAWALVHKADHLKPIIEQRKAATAEKRRHQQRVCPQCGTSFGPRSNGVFNATCSKRCGYMQISIKHRMRFDSQREQRSAEHMNG